MSIAEHAVAGARDTAPPMANDDNADQILSALAVGVRRDILARLAAGPPAGPKELAKQLGLPLPNVAYHVTILRDAGLIELVRTEPRRGAVAHFYRRARKHARQVDDVLAIARRLR